MTVIVCVCDGGGMLFNGRRLSRDAAVIKDVESLVGDGIVFISNFSEKLFEDSSESVISVSDPLESAKDDFAFIEDMALLPYAEKIDELVIYRWNRRYPFDFKLDIDPEKEGMTLAQTVDIVGNSHAKITRETWRKNL